MPGGKTTDRISGRDLAVLEWVARVEEVPRPVLARRVGPGRSVTFEREKRLRDHGLVRVHPTYAGPLLLATGLATTGRDEPGVARPSPWQDHHSSIVAEVAASLELAGERVRSEREIGARERAEGGQPLSAQVTDYRYHRADLIRLGERAPGDRGRLTAKARRWLEQLLAAWRRAVIQGKVARVIYLCAPDPEPYVRRAVERTLTEGQVLVLPLTHPDVRLPRPASPQSGAQAQAVEGRRPDPGGVDG